MSERLPTAEEGSQQRTSGTQAICETYLKSVGQHTDTGHRQYMILILNQLVSTQAIFDTEHRQFKRRFLNQVILASQVKLGHPVKTVNLGKTASTTFSPLSDNSGCS